MLAGLFIGMWLPAMILVVLVTAHAAMLFYQILSWRYDLLVITDRRLVQVSGLLAVTMRTMEVGKIIEVTYHRSAIGRVLGYGSIHVTTAAEDHPAIEQIDHLPCPDAVHGALLS